MKQLGSKNRGLCHLFLVQASIAKTFSVPTTTVKVLILLLVLMVKMVNITKTHDHLKKRWEDYAGGIIFRNHIILI